MIADANLYSYDTNGDRCPESPGRWRFCQEPAFRRCSFTHKAYVDLFLLPLLVAYSDVIISLLVFQGRLSVVGRVIPKE